MRDYICIADDGHECFDFCFSSDSRIGSSAIEQDARKQYRRLHGRRNFKIVSITRE